MKYSKEQISFCLEILKRGSCFSLETQCSKCLIYKDCSTELSFSNLIQRIIKNIIYKDTDEENK